MVSLVVKVEDGADMMYMNLVTKTGINYNCQVMPLWVFIANLGIYNCR